VRSKESWCSLCYQDLRPQEPQEAQEPLVATSNSGTAVNASPAMEANPGPRRAINIAGIPHPSSPSAQESLDFGDGFPVGGAALDAGLDGGVSLDKDVKKAWPCRCGNEVPFDVDTCPECGNGFLAELRGVDRPERSGPAWMTTYLEASRTMRLTVAAVFALAVAVGIPGLLALFS
jgi:hypothetical protein